MSNEDPAAADLLNSERVEMLRELDDGKGEMLMEIFDMFLEETPARIAALASAVEAGDAEASHRAAHGIKGSAYNMGAQRLGDLAGELETKGRGGSIEGAPGLFEQIRTAFDESCAALNAAVGRG